MLLHFSLKKHLFNGGYRLLMGKVSRSNGMNERIHLPKKDSVPLWHMIKIPLQEVFLWISNSFQAKYGIKDILISFPLKMEG